MNRFLARALVASLSACATTPATSPQPGSPPVEASPTPGPATANPLDRADAALMRAEVAYARARSWSDMRIAALPAPYAARLATIRAACDQALAAARTAVTLAQRAAALKTLEAQMRRLATESGAAVPY